MPIGEEQLRNTRDEEIQELHRQLREKDKIFENYRSEHGKLEVFFRRVLDTVEPLQPIKNIYNPDYSHLKVESPIIAVSQFSDWHTGEVQYADEIEGFNAYSPEIEDRRLEHLNKVTLDSVEYHRGAYRIDENRILVTGDLISGDIHLELSVTNAYPVPVQVVEAAKKLARTVAIRSSHFTRVIVDFISEDNHARLTRKPQAKEAGYNSFNYLVGVLAKEYLSKYENVEFNIYPMNEKVVEVNGRQYLIGHGHGIVGWMGVPWYSIERKVGKEAKNRLQLIMGEQKRIKDVGFHKYIFGHWHTEFNNDSYGCSASLSGTSAYDHGQGRFGLPGQPLWMVHPKWGEFNRTNIILDLV